MQPMANASRSLADGQRARGSIWSTATVLYVALLAFTVIVVTARWGGAEAAIGIALLGLLASGSDIRVPRPFLWGVVLIAWAFATSPLAISPDLAQATVVDRLKLIAIFWVVMNAIRTERQLRIFLMIFVASFLIYPARGAILNYLHGETLFGRAIWNHIYNNPNDLAAMALLALGAALSLSAWTAQKTIIRWAAAACAATFLIVILLTQSRGGILGLTLGFAPPLFARLFKKPLIPICVAISIVVAISILPQSLWVRLSGMRDLTSTATIAEADPEGSAAQRWEIQKTAWKIFSDHPLVGVGLGCYPVANRRYAPNLGARDTHNTYLNLAAELGIPGLLMWVGLVVSVLRQGVAGTNRPPANHALQAMKWLKYSIFAYLTAGLFGTYSGITMIYLALGVYWAASNISSAPAAGSIKRMTPSIQRSR